jgi:hypothetical protein
LLSFNGIRGKNTHTRDSEEARFIPTFIFPLILILSIALSILWIVKTKRLQYGIKVMAIA